MAPIPSKVFDYLTELIQLLQQWFFFFSSLEGQLFELNRWLSFQSFHARKPSDATFKRSYIRLSAYLRYIIFLRISLTWWGRGGKVPRWQVVSKLFNRIWELEEWSCGVFLFSMISCLRVYWAVPLFFFFLMIPFWVPYSKD